MFKAFGGGRWLILIGFEKTLDLGKSSGKEY
jgi:hypothetical protein